VSLQLLIVDDSDEFLASAARLLETQGMRVVGSATSAAEALRLAEELEPDVALVDVELGEEDGVALARELEARRPPTRTILISAHEREDLGLAGGDEVSFLPKSDLGAEAIEQISARRGK
jgi:two-component system nitrate/nitrite response regulator NarL